MWSSDRPDKRSTDMRPIGPGEKYLDYVRDVPCCNCGKPVDEGAKTNTAQFPISRGAGAPATRVIPMCGECHLEHHAGPVAFVVQYQRQ
jgi:hypothetical protein